MVGVQQSPSEADAVEVRGDAGVLTYRPHAVTLPDGTVVTHESRGGTLASAVAVEVPPWFVEVAHVGDGPEGGELVMSVSRTDGTGEHVVCVGALWTADEPRRVDPSWPAAVDLALGLVTADTVLLAPAITRDELETFHQRLLGALHG